MRPRRIMSAVAVLLCLSAGARAETFPFDAVVGVPEVEVRSGPSPKAYPTGKLYQNDRVKVLREEDGGWLAVAPPPGSFSWVNGRFLGAVGPSTLVRGENVPVRVGSALLAGPGDKQQVHLQRGSWVVVIGKEMPAGDGVWYPIQPPPAEVRYVPRDAVRTTTVQMVSSSPPGGSAPVPSPVTPAPAPGATGAADPLLMKAEAAERAGNLAEAERLYTQLALQTADPGRQILYRNRIVSLRERMTASVMPPVRAPQRTEAGYPSAGNRVAATPAGGPPTTPLPYPGPSQTAARPATAPGMPAPPSRWGWLRRTSFDIDGRPGYALVTDREQLLLYATAQGVNLEPYVGRMVQVWGPMSYHGVLRTDHMTITAAQPLR